MKKKKKINISLLIMIIVVVVIIATILVFISLKNNNPSCDSFSYETCPSKCVICPPCAVCSSISCQTEEFCKNSGFNRTWAKGINP